MFTHLSGREVTGERIAEKHGVEYEKLAASETNSLRAIFGHFRRETHRNASVARVVSSFAKEIKISFFCEVTGERKNHFKKCSEKCVNTPRTPRALEEKGRALRKHVS